MAPASLLALHDEKDRLVSEGYHVELVMGVQIVLIAGAEKSGKKH